MASFFRAKSLVFLLLFMLSTVAHATELFFDDCYDTIEQPGRKALCNTRKKTHECSHSVAGFFGQMARDAVYLHIRLISWDSFKIITTAFPFFIATRMMDEKLQSCFYDPMHHKNVGQLPTWCSTFAKYSIGFPIFFFGLRGLMDKDPEWRAAGRVYLIGMPFVVFGKDIIKNFRFDAALRPWNQNFSKEERSCGGFPSGHMAEAAYSAVLFGTRFGWRYAVPLTFMAGYLGVTFLNCNRHYVSQLVAGAAFGAMYAVAANKVIDSRLSDDWSLNLCCGNHGETMVDVNYRF